MDNAGPEKVALAELRYGPPRVVSMAQEILPWEFDLIERICGDVRYHDVVIFAFSGTVAGTAWADASMALIHKPSDPPGALWVATGGVEPGESLEGAVAREAYEELGIKVRPVRYALRVDALFECEGRTRPWSSHVFVAVPSRNGRYPEDDGGAPPLAPVDRHEVEYAQWVGVDEFRREVVPVLLESGWGRFRYRLAVTEHLFAELGLSGV